MGGSFVMDDLKQSDVLHELSSQQGAMEDLEAEREMLEKALSIKCSRCGTEALEYVNVLSTYSVVLAKLGYLHSARRNFIHCLRVKQLHGQDNVSVARTMVNLANTCNLLGELQEAVKLFQAAG